MYLKQSKIIMMGERNCDFQEYNLQIKFNYSELHGGRKDRGEKRGISSNS